MAYVIHVIGVCLGMQVAVIEFARNVLGWKGKLIYTIYTGIITIILLDANSKEFDPSTSHPVVSALITIQH